MKPSIVQIQRKFERVSKPIPLSNLTDYRELVPLNWRPKLRATRSSASDGVSGITLRYVYQEIHHDGLLETGFLSVREVDHERLDPIFRNLISTNLICDCEIPVSIFANIVEWISRIRIHANARLTEYAIEVEITARGGNVNFQRPKFYKYDSVVGELSVGTYKFPNYHMAESEENVDLVALFERDLWNLLGRDLGDSQGCLGIIAQNM